jgi:hypothetical protein
MGLLSVSLRGSHVAQATSTRKVPGPRASATSPPETASPMLSYLPVQRYFSSTIGATIGPQDKVLGKLISRNESEHSSSLPSGSEIMGRGVVSWYGFGTL